MIEAYKLLRVRADGSLGPLFINARLRITPGVWLAAEDHPTKGYAHRPGWHAVGSPIAPHLSPKGRAWFRVQLRGARRLVRPASQGAVWWLATSMRVVGPYQP